MAGIKLSPYNAVIVSPEKRKIKIPMPKVI
jgi:hypothetical protein